MLSKNLLLKLNLVVIVTNATLLPIHDCRAQEQAKSADGFVNFIGVNTHVGSTSGPYSNISNVQSELTSLGVRHIRDNAAPPATQTYINNLETLAGAGIHTDLMMDGSWFPCGAGGYPNGYGSTALTASAVIPYITSFNGAIESVEPCNETDVSTMFDYLGQGFPNGTVAFSQAFYNIIKGNSATSSLPVILTSVADDENSGLTNEYSSMTAITPGPVSYCDWGNMHCYPGGENPGYNGQWLNLCLADQIGWLQGTASSPGIAYGKPFVTTETGYENYTDQWSVDQRTGGYYMPRLLLTHFNTGEQRCWLYELYDDSNYTGSEASYGLVTSTGAPKPAYTAIKNMIGILAEPGASFTPGQLTYTLSAPSTVRHTLLEKSNGDYFLAIWNEVSSYNLSAKGASSGDISNPTVGVTVTLPSNSVFSVYAPNDSTGQAPTNAYTSNITATSISLNVPDRVLIVQIRPRFATGNTHPYYLSSQYTGGYMNVQNGFVCAPYLFPGAWSQEWYLTPTGNGEYYLCNLWTGNAINMQSGFACSNWWSGEQSAYWNLVPTGNGGFYLNNPYSETGINTQNSTFECTSTWGGEVSAMWNIIPATN
jgi:hypothetical protein